MLLITQFAREELTYNKIWGSISIGESIWAFKYPAVLMIIFNPSKHRYIRIHCFDRSPIRQS